MDPSVGILNTCPNVLQGVSAHMFLSLINSLMVAKCGLGSDGQYPPNYGPQLKDGDEFDFIIVGAGSAGSVVANRLSEVPEWKVLLLEAGGYPSGMSEIPALLFSLQDTEEDWKYKMEPCETCCLSQKNKRCRAPRGKGLGGSGLINAMMHIRSTKHDHARWVSSGNDIWDYDTAVKYYKKIENLHSENEDSDDKSGGELHLTRYTNTHPIRRILQEAYEEIGYNQYSTDNPQGFLDAFMTIYKGTRQHAAKAFLSPIRDRKNLYVATNAHVSRVLVESNVAKGVELKINQEIISLKARKEVILSAGTFNSPKILMNSGIGPKEHLSQLGIKVLKDLRVGDNLQDHVMLPVFAVGLDREAFNQETPTHVIDQLYKYFMHRDGDFATIGLTNFASFINSKNESTFSNVQYIHMAIKKQDPYVLHEIIRCLEITEEVAKPIVEYNQNSPLAIITPILLHPESRGFLRLRNSDPFSKPLIIPNFLSDEKDEDVEVMLSAVKVLQRLLITDAFAPYHPILIDPPIKNCKDLEPHSDNFWKCAIRNAQSTLYHPVGTCKMGPESDPTTVVDPQLSVHGIRRVRVIDGSVLPFITSGNTNAPIMMVAEGGAHMLKKQWLRNERIEL